MPCTATAIAFCAALTTGYVVDGDTIRMDDGAYVRLLEIDTPEKGHRAECDAERMLSVHSTANLERLISGGFTLEPEGRDRYGRILGHLRLPDGRTASEAQVSASLGVVYAGRVHDWCGAG